MGKWGVRKVLIHGLMVFLYVYPWFVAPAKYVVIFIATMVLFQFALGDIWTWTVGKPRSQVTKDE